MVQTVHIKYIKRKGERKEKVKGGLREERMCTQSENIRSNARSIRSLDDLI